MARSGFTPQQIHNTNNVILVRSGAGSPHAQITGHFNSIQQNTNGMRVRDWLANQSFNEQYQYGLQILREFGVIR